MCLWIMGEYEPWVNMNYRWTFDKFTTNVTRSSRMKSLFLIGCLFLPLRSFNMFIIMSASSAEKRKLSTDWFNPKHLCLYSNHPCLAISGRSASHRTSHSLPAEPDYLDCKDKQDTQQFTMIKNMENSDTF